MAILFHLESGKIKLPGRRKIISWLKDLIHEEGNTPGLINIILTSDEKLLIINREFLSRDYFTDIITFDYTEEGRPLNGDLYISVERVLENADKYKVTFREELLRVCAHGVLHLLGYSDNRYVDEMEMREKEDHYLGKIILDS